MSSYMKIEICLAQTFMTVDICPCRSDTLETMTFFFLPHSFLPCRYNSIHPGVTTFYGADFFPDRSSIIIATEFMELYSLKDIVAQCGAPPFPLSSKRLWRNSIPSRDIFYSLKHNLDSLNDILFAL